MKWFWNHCRRREDASLLAADVLSGEEKIAVERHLAECAQCRAYCRALRKLAAPLAGWEKNFSFVEATQAVRTRWANAVEQEAATRSDTSRSASLDAGLLRAVWRELIWPSRYAWSGLAALWVAMLIVNFHFSGHSPGGTFSSPQEIMQAREEQNRVFAEWAQPNVIGPAAPGYVPRPRSQRDEDWAVI